MFTESGSWHGPMLYSLFQYLEKRTRKREQCKDLLVSHQCNLVWGTLAGELPAHALPQGRATSSSALCRADTWHHVRCSLGSSLSWVMRLGLLEAFNYQPNVQTHFSPETFMQAQPLFTKKSKQLSPPGRQDVTPGWDFTPVKSILLQLWSTHIPAPLPNNPFSKASDPVCWVTLPSLPPDSVCIMNRRTVFRTDLA